MNKKRISSLLILISSIAFVPNAMAQPTFITVTNNGDIMCDIALQSQCGVTLSQSIYPSGSPWGASTFTFTGLNPQCVQYTVSGTIPVNSAFIGAHIHLTGWCACSDCPGVPPAGSKPAKIAPR